MQVPLYRCLQDEKDNNIMIDGSEVLQVLASYNHSMALSKNWRVYTWGYKGKGLLGRGSQAYDYLPIQIGTENVNAF